MTRLAIVGAGYVGLVTGACLAETGIEVVCVDLSPERVAEINRGAAPFHEPGLDELLTRTAGHGLSATTDLAAAIEGADVIMLAVGTPSRDGAIDLTQVRDAARLVGERLATAGEYPVVVVKSTVVPGTTRDVVTPILEAASGRTAGRDFGVGVNPEFLTEGTAIDDFAHPDRIVVGADDDARASDILTGLYAAFPDVPLLRVNTATAEMIKYASNTLLATLISFTNELANLGAAVGDVDTVEVMRGVHTSRYLTTQVDGPPPKAAITSFLGAGTGYGGSCLPKDTQALIARGEELGQPMRVLRAVEAVNQDQAGELIRILRDGMDLSGARITVLGLAFKPDTDDVRESPAFRVIRSLVDAGAIVTAHDPVAIEPARRVLGDLPVRYEVDLAVALAEAQAAVIVTRWREYEVVPDLIAGRTPAVLVVDGRRMLAPGSVERYRGIGR